MDSWNCWLSAGFKILIPALLLILFFELVIRRATKNNKKTYDDYLKSADAINQKVFANQAEMITILKEIRDLLKKERT